VSEPVRYCKDCKWSLPRGLIFKSYKFAKCSNPAANRDGDVFVYPGAPGTYCSIARQFLCGRDGEFWESKS
jgi:hypothetical protein